MALSTKALQHLARLGYAAEADLRFWRWLWESRGEPAFWAMIREVKKTVKDYDHWFPRLQAFASECRRAAPVPTMDSLSAAEREQYCILLAKMRDFAGSEDGRHVLAGKPHRVAILSTTRVGLLAAEETFGASGAMILEESEQARWLSEVCRVKRGRFWWCAFAWWTLQEAFTDEDELNIRREYPIPDGCAYWMIASGVQMSGLCGSDRRELWRWDGARAEFIALYSFGTS